MFSKLDIADGFWRMVCEGGQEWNFGYVLPAHSGGKIEIVIPSALQMGWAESPAFFCAASEIARDVAATYVAEAKCCLPEHQLEELRCLWAGHCARVWQHEIVRHGPVLQWVGW